MTTGRDQMRDHYLSPGPLHSLGTEPTASDGLGKLGMLLSFETCKPLPTGSRPRGRCGRAYWPFYWHWSKSPPFLTTQWGWWMPPTATKALWTLSGRWPYRRVRGSIEPSSPTHMYLTLPLTPDIPSCVPLCPPTHWKQWGAAVPLVVYGDNTIA